MAPLTPQPDPAEKIASLARMNIDLLRYIRVLREEYEAQSLVLSVALEQSHQLHLENKRKDERYYSLLEQYRALRTTGVTVPEAA